MLSPFLLRWAPDGTNTISSICKTEHFPQTFAKNAILDDSWLVPPSPIPLDYFMLLIKSFVMMFSIPSLA